MTVNGQLERPGAPGRFEALDGWRGACALLVAGYHFNPAANSTLGPLIGNGYLFVDFFFVLSGFVICHTYGGKLRRMADLAPFMIKRFARLYPLHLAIIGFYVAVELARWSAGAVESGRAPFTDNRSIPSLLANLALVQGLGFSDALSWNGPSWSISVEFWTYAAFAILALLAGRRLAFVVAAVALAALAALIATGAPKLNLTTDHAFLRCLAGFFVGALVRLVVVRPAGEGARPLAPVGFVTAVEAAALAGSLAFVALAGAGRWSFAAPLVFAGVVAAFASGRGRVSQLLASPAFTTLGALSYAVYMIHALGVYAVNTAAKVAQHATGAPVTAAFVEDGRSYQILSLSEPWAMDLAMLAFLAGVVLAAALLRRFVELPGQAFLLDRLLARKRAESEPARVGIAG